MTALYAAVQFVFAPVLGALSDRIGRRPVLLISLAGAAINYLFLAFACSLGLLFAGRAIAGLTSANVSVAAAYLTDITEEDQRARRFGLMNAMFGIGFIVGPVLGGLLGDHWLRLPFIAAAVLNGANLLFAFMMLSESREPSHEKVTLAALNPLKPLGWVFQVKSLWPLIVIFFLLSATGEAYGTAWALWGGDTFGWNGLMIGLSLGAFGICQTLAQAFLPGPAVKLLGERFAILVGLIRHVRGADRDGVRHQGLDRVRHHARVRPRRPRRAGPPSHGNAAGERQPARPVPGGVGVSAEFGVDRGAAGVFQHSTPWCEGTWPGAVWLSVVAVYAVAAVMVGRR